MSVPVFSPNGIPPRIAQPLKRWSHDVQSFLRRAHRNDGSIAAIQNWTDIPYRSSLFTFSGTGAWVVTQPNIANLMYARADRVLFLKGAIVSTNVTAPLGTELRVGLPEDFRWKSFAVDYLIYSDAGAAFAAGAAVMPAGARYLSLQTLAFGNWTATAGNDTTVYFNVCGDIRL